MKKTKLSTMIDAMLKEKRMLRKIILSLTVLSFSVVLASEQIEKVSKQKFLIEKIMPCDKKAFSVGNSIFNTKEKISFIAKDKTFTYDLKEGFQNKYSICKTKDGKYLLKVENITYKIKN